MLLRVGIAANTRQMGRDKLDEVVRNREEHGASTMRYGRTHLRRIAVCCMASLFAGFAGRASAGAEPAASNVLAIGIQEFTLGANEWSRSHMTNAVAIFDTAGRVDSDSFLCHYWKGAAQFHVLLHRLGVESDKQDADAILRNMADAIQSLEHAVQLKADHGESHALLSTIHGLRIARRPMTALGRGPKVLRHKRKALAVDAPGPRVYYLLGMSSLHAPGFLGGRDEAMEFLLKAEKLFEAERKKGVQPLLPSWGYDHCLAFLGEAYCQSGHEEKGRAYYQKALAVNPKHKKARDGLAACTKTGAAGP